MAASLVLALLTPRLSVSLLDCLFPESRMPESIWCAWMFPGPRAGHAQRLCVGQGLCLLPAPWSHWLWLPCQWRGDQSAQPTMAEPTMANFVTKSLTTNQLANFLNI